MVNIGLQKVDDALVAKHPGLQTYTACQSHAFMKGTGSFILGTAGLFAIQKVLQKKLPYPLQWNLLISISENGVISGQLRSDSLGNAEVHRPLVADRDGKSPRQIATTSTSIRGIKRISEDQIWRRNGLNIAFLRTWLIFADGFTENIHSKSLLEKVLSVFNWNVFHISFSCKTQVSIFIIIIFWFLEVVEVLNCITALPGGLKDGFPKSLVKN